MLPVLVRELYVFIYIHILLLLENVLFDCIDKIGSVILSFVYVVVEQEILISKKHICTFKKSTFKLDYKSL